ncbi:hypothetical protein [Chelativorans sp.]|nr:hypothetical protein [Chelativorans sp.]
MAADRDSASWPKAASAIRQSHMHHFAGTEILKAGTGALTPAAGVAG